MEKRIIYFFPLNILLGYNIYIEFAMSIYSGILEDVSKSDSILESPDIVYHTDDASIYDGAFRNTSLVYNIKTKDPEKWLLPSESYFRIEFAVVNAAQDAALAATELVTMISGGLHMFSQCSLKIDDNQVEVISRPGMVHLIDHLINTTKDCADTVSKDQWVYVDGGGITTGAYTAATVAPNIATVLQAQFLGGAATGVNTQEFWGLADPYRMAGTTANGTNLEVGGRNPKFNAGFFARWARSAGSRVVELAIPAANVFGFFADLRNAFRGIQFECEFQKNTAYAEYLHGMGRTSIVSAAPAAANKAAAAAAALTIRKIEWVMPTIIPSGLEAEKALKSLQSGKKARKVFGSTTCYTINNVYAADPNFVDWRIVTTNKRITKVVIAFQRGPQYSTQNDPDFTATTLNHSNGGTFTYFSNISSVELRLGSTIMPRERYQNLNFGSANPDYLRNYIDMCDAGGTWQNDNGNMVSPNEFRNLYPLFVFDLSAMSYANGFASEDLRVVANFTRPAGVAAGQPYRILALVSYEYPIDFVGADGRLGIELP